MSELTHEGGERSRSQFLATVSMLSLLAAAGSAGHASAAGDQGWRIELGWHAETVYMSQDDFALPLDSAIPQSGLTGPLVESLNLSSSQGGEGKVSFQPQGSNWTFSASIQYGRSKGRGHLSQTQPIPTTSFTTFHTTIPTYPFPYHSTKIKPLKLTSKNIDVETSSAETHLLLDFQAGADVGVGLFGKGSMSHIGGGVRFAQFTSALNVSQFQANPDSYFTQTQTVIQTNAFFPSGIRQVPWYFLRSRQLWHSFGGSPHGSHSFNGIGPSVYWDVSAPLWNASPESGVSLDWGLNAALLFGRQKDRIEHRTTSVLGCYGAPGPHCDGLEGDTSGVMRNTSVEVRTKNVMVPNIGAFAGASYHWKDVDAIVGYRADFFINAIRTGMQNQTTTVGFVGPYANVSVALGG